MQRPVTRIATAIYALLAASLLIVWPTSAVSAKDSGDHYNPYAGSTHKAKTSVPLHAYGYKNLVQRTRFANQHGHEPGDTLAQVPCVNTMNQCTISAPSRPVTRAQAATALGQKPAVPVVTPAMVRAAVLRVDIPAYPSLEQPAGKTLVNFETIFYTRARPITRHLHLAGQPVTLTLRPTRFTWHYGDGTTATTTIPGAPYPSKQITHRYQQAHTTLDHAVTITWTATYQIGNGPTRTVPGTRTITGPATPLRIAEADPALSGYGH